MNAPSASVSPCSRRVFQQSMAALVLGACWTRAHALGLDDFSNADAASAVRAALEKGALAAVGEIGRAHV